MHLPNLLQQRFSQAIESITDQAADYASMIRSTADPRHGDYQANCAMPISKLLGRNPREVATAIVERLDLSDLCEPIEIAGPGFINLRLKDSFLQQSLQSMLGDARCGVPSRNNDHAIVIDFSSPNVAKPMHVGHIRSTVIGDSLARSLRFLGYRVITDNHLGDWGTQFGIIIYGYKHFGDPTIVAADPVNELAKLYRLVNQLIEYRKATDSLANLQNAIESAQRELQDARTRAEQADAAKSKQAEKLIAAAERRLAAAEANLESAQRKIDSVDRDPQLSKLAQAHPDIDHDVLEETAKLHRGDTENLSLWEKFLPHCKDEINRVYDRLNVNFDHTLGESFYHNMLEGVVEKLQAVDLARESDGAICVFLPEFDAPMIVRKQDGAFLYATTDLATLQYRLEQFHPAEILYVVDTRQSEHFEKLFAVAHHFGLQHVKLVHVNFGTVLGEDGRPLKTRSGTLIGLESLLDDAVQRARQVVCNPERLAGFDPPMDEAEQQLIAEVVGIGAIKFADLSHHRTSDYRFNLDKMVALEGDTSTYVQYSYARTQKILENAQKMESDVVAMIDREGWTFTHPAERALALMLIKFEESLVAVHKDYAPNQLVDYLLETAKIYSKFNENCHVLRAETAAIQATRLALVSLTGRLLRLGLELLGISVVPRM
jgi:arginyl-tRNA synthetase